MTKLWSVFAFFILFGLPRTNTLAQNNFTGIRKLNGAALFLSSRGSGEPLLVLHGGPGLNHSYFIPHLEGLERSLNVIYYDQRACGQSSTPSSDSISINFLVDDIEAIRKEMGIARMNILAHSWGSVLAAHYASRYADNVKGIIFSNPAMLSREYDQQAAALVKGKTTQADSVERAGIFGSGTLDSKKYDALLRISFRISAYDRANISKINLNLPGNFMDANRALFNALMKDPSFNVDMYKSASSFRFPVLIIHGDSDVIPRQSIDRLKEIIPNSRLIVFKKSGHFPFVEEQESYALEILRFINDK